MRARIRRSISARISTHSDMKFNYLYATPTSTKIGGRRARRIQIFNCGNIRVQNQFTNLTKMFLQFLHFHFENAGRKSGNVTVVMSEVIKWNVKILSM